jgi:hypothetical protein
MLRQRAVFFEWPFPPHQGETVRFFDMVGPFVISKRGETWLVQDSRKNNYRGGPDHGFTFDNLNDVIAHMNANL